MILEQSPEYDFIPAGQEHIIYTIYDTNTITANPPKHKIKYIAHIHIKNNGNNMSDVANRVAILKVTPNAVGRGVIDIAPVIRNYVSPDYTGGQVHTQGGAASAYSNYKGTAHSETTPHSIHQVDKFSTNRKSVRYVRVKFFVESADTATGTVTQSGGYWGHKLIVFNGVLDDTDVLKMNTGSGDFGFQLDNHKFLPRTTDSKLLTNAPTKQYIQLNQYMTIPFLSQLSRAMTGFGNELGGSGTTHPAVKRVCYQYYYNGSTTGSQINQDLSTGAGGHYGMINESATVLQFFGVGTANQVNAGNTLPANWDYYRLWLQNDQGDRITQYYDFYFHDANCKGYENIRLVWLNKWGTWDYYNFTMKNIRTLSTSRKSYQQVSGEWNSYKFNLNGHTGGMKNYYSAITERITLNTDNITEDEAIWLQELFVSNDVYILENDSAGDTGKGTIRKYVKPVRIVSEDFIKKTSANDGVMQYTFEIETNRTKKAQRI